MSVVRYTGVNFALTTVRHDGTHLRYLSEYRNDPRVVLKAVKQNGLALQYASSNFRNDPEIVLEAVKQRGCALEFASTEIRADGRIAWAAVQQNGSALRFASEKLRGDRRFVWAAVQQTVYALQFATNEIRSDRQIVLATVLRHASALECASEELRGDSQIVLAAVGSHHDYAIKHAHIPGLAKSIAAGTVDHCRILSLVGQRRSLEDVFTLLKESPELCSRHNEGCSRKLPAGSSQPSSVPLARRMKPKSK